MKFSLKMRYVMGHCLDCHQTCKDFDSKSLLYFCDLDLIFKIKSQLTDVKFPLNAIFLKPVDGYSSNLHGYVFVTCLRFI